MLHVGLTDFLSEVLERCGDLSHEWADPGILVGKLLTGLHVEDRSRLRPLFPLHVVGKVDDLVSYTVDMHEHLILFLLEMERVRPRVDDNDRCHLSPVLEDACVIHEVVDDLSVGEGLISKRIDVLLLQLVEKDIIED